MRDPKISVSNSSPQAIKGGIKARSSQGDSVRNWWARRWISLIEQFPNGLRLSRGREYAGHGRVLSIQIDSGEIRSAVQGSRPRPYEVVIRSQAIDSEGWQRLFNVLGAQAIFVAKLLAGEMPHEIEGLFADENLSLFPDRVTDLHMECDCPKVRVPCKHIAAVFYLFGEEFDRDPFLLFQLRGMDPESLLHGLNARIAGAAPHRKGVGGFQEEEQTDPIAVDPTPYWQGMRVPPDLFGEVHIPTVPGALLKRLGPFPFWQGTKSIAEALEPMYVYAAEKGLDLFVGEEWPYSLTRELLSDPESGRGEKQK